MADDHSLLRFGADMIWVGVAAVGGIARYLDAYLRTGAKPQLGLLFGHAAVSGFSGWMVAQTVLHLSPDWALVAAGIGGYLGTQGLDWLATIMRARFGGELPTDIHDRRYDREDRKCDPDEGPHK